MEHKTRPRFEVLTAGENEPGLLLIADHFSGYIVARGSEMVRKQMAELVAFANLGFQQSVSASTNEEKK